MAPRRAQLARLRRVAVEALRRYPVVADEVRLVNHGENTTYRVTGRSVHDGSAVRLLLRVHRPGRHGRLGDPALPVRSELTWLEAIKAGTELEVPEPLRTSEGEQVTTVDPDDVGGAVDEPRVCSTLRWMDGRIHESSARPVHLRRVGAATAQLHAFTDAWRPPGDFVRLRWDWEAFFGDVMEYGGASSRTVWSSLPTSVASAFDAVAERAEGVMAALGTDAPVWGLRHADLHLGNTLFHGDRVRLIDFDDSGDAHRAYELAVTLWELRDEPGYEQHRDALLEGYRSYRPISDAEVDLLDDFIAIRHVAFGLWFAGTARVDEAFAARLDETLGWCERSIRDLLR